MNTTLLQSGLDTIKSIFVQIRDGRPSAKKRSKQKFSTSKQEVMIVLLRQMLKNNGSPTKIISITFDKETHSCEIIATSLATNTSIIMCFPEE